MNERIQELLEQAGVKYTIMPKDTVYEKFAELIIRECGNWIVENAEAMEHLGPDYFAKAMTKDFGVEE